VISLERTIGARGIDMSEHAAVLREIGKPLELEDIELADIAPDQVRVRIAASGVCHSDLSQATGALPAGTPCVLGHEGAGVVEEVGAEVHHVKPGDHVVIAWTAACGQCWFCRRGEVHLCRNAIADSYSMPYAADLAGAPLFTSMGVSSFATATNCLGRAVVPIDDDIPLDIASLVGCGVATGAGAALNTAPVEHGSAVAVIGLGGVGLAALMAAVVRGAATVIAVDPVATRRETAAELGATHLVDPADGDVARQIRVITGKRGADIVFEAVGRSATIETAVKATRRGGTTCVVGAAMPGDNLTLSAYDLFMNAKTLVGCQYGSVVPGRDFPMLLDLWRGGRLPLDRLVSRRVGLDEVNDAFDDLTHGRGIRTVIVSD
jgi:S-(hydroxymethyl)glutathione dehydrogenase/alcohol dehydrogenase